MHNIIIPTLLLAAGLASAVTNQVSITQDNNYRYIKSNGIPHTHGNFPNSRNPNSIEQQDYNFRIPLHPKLNSNITAINRFVFGVGLNGIPFLPETAGYWNDDPNWREEAMIDGEKRLGLDSNNAHVQQGGVYHYHGVPTELIRNTTPNSFSPLVGWAADGYPIYAEYGYRVANNPNSGIKKLTSSYALKQGTRPNPPNGPGGHYNGFYTQDYEYVGGKGDLDQCNGRFGSTPDFPDGTYYYVITKDFPYIPRCFKGQPDTSFRRINLNSEVRSMHSEQHQSRKGHAQQRKDKTKHRKPNSDFSNN